MTWKLVARRRKKLRSNSKSKKGKEKKAKSAFLALLFYSKAKVNWVYFGNHKITLISTRG